MVKIIYSFNIKAIKEKMKSKSISVYDFARRLGMSESAANRFLNSSGREYKTVTKALRVAGALEEPDVHSILNIAHQ